MVRYPNRHPQRGKALGQDEHARVARHDLFRLSALVLSVTCAVVALLSMAGSPTWLLILLSGTTASLAVVRGAPALLLSIPPTLPTPDTPTRPICWPAATSTNAPTTWCC
jgi:hypothetical protein